MGLGDLLFKGDHKIFFQRHKAADKKAELSWRELCLSVSFSAGKQRQCKGRKCCTAIDLSTICVSIKSGV